MNASPEQEAEVLKHFRGLFENNEPTYYERGKNEADAEIIRDVLVRLPDFVREFGGTPLVKLGLEHIHIIDEGKLTEEQRKSIKNERGWYLTTHQAAYIVADVSTMRTAEALVHELMHFNSFTSLVLLDKEFPQGHPPLQVGERKLLVRRIGLNIFDDANTQRFVHDLDEAVIEELTKRFDERYFREIGSLSEECADREKIRSRVTHPEEIAAVLTSQLENGEWQSEIIGYAYKKQRDRLNALVRDIYESKPGRFGSTEEIFKVFAGAVLSGRLLELARLIEQTFGKGAFRKLALSTV